jgi:glycosyltransferase involved in cell wall biosynthesis
MGTAARRVRHAPSSHPRRRGHLRVAMVVPPYFDVPPQAYGGVEAVVADMTDALIARGHAVTLIGAGRPGTRADFLPVWDRTVPEQLGEPFPEVMHALASRRAVERLISQRRVDLVHDHTLAGALNAAGYAAAGIPTVVTVHGPVDDRTSRYYAALRDEVALVAISHRQRALAPGLNWVGTVHNGLRLDTWPMRREKGDFALFLGRFHPDKAPHLALDAAHAAGLRLVLAGKCTESIEQEYYETEVLPRLTSRDTVVGVADADAKRRLLARARCLLFPVQWEEPFGMVMIESMACGTPVVALRAGAVPEIVVPGVTGIICDRPEELPGALHEVAQIRPDACRAHVGQHFSAASLAAGYEQVYRRVLARPGAGPAGAASPRSFDQYNDIASEVVHEDAAFSSVRAGSATDWSGRVRTATTLPGPPAPATALVGRSSGPDPMTSGTGQGNTPSSASRVRMRRYGMASAAHTTAKTANATR